MHPLPLLQRLTTFAVLSVSIACSQSPKARSAGLASPETRELKHRLASLSEKVDSSGLYYDDDVRSSIDAMPRSLLERMLPAEGFQDENANRTSSRNCTAQDMYGAVNECSRSLVNFLRSYASFAQEKPSEFSGPPKWSQKGDSLVVVFDSHFYELEFRRADLKLIAVRYRAREE